MAQLTHQFTVEGVDIGLPANWLEAEISAVFSQTGDDDSLIPENQPNLSIDRFHFVGEAAQFIADRHKSGLNGGPGAFQGACAKWVIQEGGNSYTVFDGYLDFTDNYQELEFKDTRREQPNQVFVKAVDDFGLNALLQKISGVTMDLLLDKGVYSDEDYVDIPFVIIRKYDYLEFMMLFFSIYIFQKEAVEVALRIKKIIADGFSGGFTAVLTQILKLIAEVAYLVFIVVQLINLAREIYNLLYSKKRIHKGITMRKLFEKAFDFFGYKFVSPIEELDNFTILPTLPTKKSNFFEDLFNKVRVTEVGVPGLNDWGYIFTDNLTTARRLFRAKLAVYNNNGTKEVHVRNEGDEWFLKQSNLTLLNDVLVDSVGYNHKELSRGRVLKFVTDSTDAWTREEKKGTMYETITESTPQDPDNNKNLITGLEETIIPYALGVRKANLTPLEQLILAGLGFAEDAINAVGGNINLTQGIQNRPNFLKMSEYEIDIAKLLYVKGGGIPSNHREILGAKALEQKYHRTASFINYSNDRPFGAQYQTFDDVTIPFNLSKFVQLRNNSYFVTDDGQAGRIDSIQWTPSEDSAKISGRFNFVYDKSLKELNYELKNTEDD